MGLKRYKPITPGLRHRVSSDFDSVTKTEPEKTLIKGTKRGRGNGRNNNGRITMRHRGGGTKRFIRDIDFKRAIREVEAKVAGIEYDPNRSARIALLHYTNGQKAYILAPNGLKVGDRVIAGERVPIQAGNAMPIKNIPVGTIIHNVELKPGKGGQFARSAGTFCKLDGKDGKYAAIRMPSGEIRLVLQACFATIGAVGNAEQSNFVLGKAGRSRHIGVRPTVRGVAMNATDHPHGGGRGRQKGYKTPTSPWGTPSKGYRTRKKNKTTNRYIISRRKK